MTPPRYSIRAMIFLVLLVAVDIVGFQKILAPPTFVWAQGIMTMQTFLGLGVGLELPFMFMANVLAVAGYPLLARREGRPRRAAFVLGGLFGSAVCYAYLRVFPHLETAVSDLFRPFQYWIMDNRNPGNPGHDARYAASLALEALAGTLALLALSALSAVLVRLVASRKVPWFVAVALVVVLMGSASLRLRYIRYREIAIRHEEIIEVLSSEMAAREKQLEGAKNAGPSPVPPVGGEIKTQEAEIAQYKVKLAENRRYLANYRRAMSRPWMPVEE